MPSALDTVVKVLKERTSHDFSRYKRSTLERRVLRRMALLDVSAPTDYALRLRQDPAEAEAMFRELLIGVTQFFRDKDAFQALEKNVIPGLFAGKGAADTVRVWIPGCSTGEEAFSVAILLAEHAASLPAPGPKLQVFATDLDERALAFARKAAYPPAIADQIAPQRLVRFFVRRGRGFEVKKELRSHCVFSLHNLIKDPPFSKLDLISCRNLLIYLEPDLQRKVLPLFHHSLKPGGYLFLGPSEHFADRANLFRAVDKRHRLFQRKPASGREARELTLPDGGPVTLQSLPAPALPPPSAVSPARAIERLLLDEFAPPSAVVDGQGEVLYFFGKIGPFLAPQSGAVSNKLVQLVRKELRLELRGAVHQATTSRREVVRPAIPLGRRRGSAVDLLARPLPEAGRGADLFMVVFRPVTLARKVARARPAPKHAAVIEELESQLQAAREDLQTTIEELQTSNEDLKSANEELVSMNEELQSTNEELQTSKEEIQSVNDDLQRKHDELEAADNDLLNFFESAEVATMFVDVTLHLRRFTPAVARLLAGVEQDLGKPVLPLLCRVHPEVAWLELIREALGGAKPSRRIALPGGRGVFLAGFTPYRTTADDILGVVVTLTDISQAVVAEREHEQLAAIVRNSTDAIISKDLDGIITSWNAAAERTFGYSAAEAIGKPVLLIIPSERYDEELRILSHIRAGRIVESFDTYRRHKEGRLLSVSVTVSPIRDSEGRVIGASKIVRDITERQRSSQLQQELASIVESSEDAILSKDLTGIVRTWNQSACRIFGYAAPEMIGHPVDLILVPGREAEEKELIGRVKRGERIAQLRTVRRRKDGAVIDIALTLSPIRDALGEVSGVSSIARDITAAATAERELERARAELAAANQSLEDRIQARTAELVETNSQLESLVYSIAHDLRSPLRSMQAFARLILEEQGDKLNADGRHYAQRIARSAEIMDRLVLDLVDYGRTARAELERTSVDLAHAWAAALAQNEDLIRESHAEIDASGLTGSALANEPTLIQILANLLNNGIKFVDRGTRPRITARSETRPGWIRIWVEDNGVGIAPQYHERIFRVFERLQATHSSGGTGIGLAIVRKGAERMGGQSGLESAPGAGSRFWVELPLAPAPSS